MTFAKPAEAPTPLERFLRDHDIRPAHLAGESGLVPQTLVKLRYNRGDKGNAPAPRITTVAAIIAALRRITGKDVRAAMLWDLGDDTPPYEQR